MDQGMLLYIFSAGGLVFVCIFLFWFALWKFVLSKNELVRDFFDMNEVVVKKVKRQEKKK